MHQLLTEPGVLILTGDGSPILLDTDALTCGCGCGRVG